jgi:hypothetical protein
MRRKSRSSPRTSFRSFIALSHQRVPRRVFRPAVELLEKRTLLAAFTVTTTVDGGNSNPTPGSLRQAILYANSQLSGDTTITFDLPLNDPNHVYYADNGIAGSVTLADITRTTVADSQISNMDPDSSHSWWVIQPPDDLPVITNPVVIDATSQPGYQGTPFIQLDGSLAGAGADGLDIEGGDATVKGLDITDYSSVGIALLSNGNTIQGDYIGVDPTGTISEGNYDGVYVGGASDNWIGVNSVYGPENADQRNVISGNSNNGVELDAPNNVVAGNLIGMDAAGTAPLANGVGILCTSSGNRIGTTGQDGADDVLERNVIAGNQDPEVDITGTGATNNVVAGNWIGFNLDANGNPITGRGSQYEQGILIQYGASDNWIGVNTVYGPENANQGNVISDNYYGVEIYSDASPNIVAGNLIGTDPSGTQSLGNFFGVFLYNASANRIGTTGQDGAADAIEQNIIAANEFDVYLDEAGTASNVVAGNYIGTNAAEEPGMGGLFGIIIDYGAQSDWIGVNSVYGPESPDEGNIILGQSQGGIGIIRGATNNSVSGNFIGVGPDGQPLGNGWGVGIGFGAQDNSVGGTTADAGNIIADNAGPGVWMSDSGTTGNRVFANSIYGNGGLGIDLGGGYDLNTDQPVPGPDGVPLNNSQAGQPGPNNWQNFPVLSAAFSGDATSVLGTLNSAPNTTFTIDFYANPAPDPSGYGQGQTWLGSASVTTDSTGNASFDDSNLAATSPDEWISATASDPGGDTSEFCQDVVVNPVTAPNLQAALNNAQEEGWSGSVTLQTTSNSDVCTDVEAINGVSNPNPVNLETVTLDLDGGTYTTDTQVNAQPGVTLVITNGTLVGGSPALVVDSGSVVLDGVTALNATAAPTILVNGGSLTVRDSTIQESTGYGEAAISITGGSVDLGTDSNPGGNTINVNGAGELIDNTTSSTVAVVGDTFSIDGIALASADVSPATDYWINLSGGDWDTPSNWSTGAVPGASDDVVIDLAGVTVTHSSSVSDAVNSLTIPVSGVTLDLSSGSLAITATSSIAGDLTMSGGTLSTASNLSFTGSLTWTGGTITGGGTLSILAAATLTLGDPSAANTAEVLNGVTLDNAGGGTLSSTSFNTSYGLVLENGAVFDNQSTGTFTFLFDGVITGDSTTSFINEGMLTVPVGVAGVYPALIASPLTQTSTGSTVVEAGTLILGSGCTISGPVTVDTGATLYFGSTGSYALDSSSSISGAGNVVATAGPVTDDGVYNISGTTLVGYGSLTFPSDAVIDNLGADLEITNSGALNIASSQSFGFSSLLIYGGTLTGGGGDLTVTGTMSWVGGTLSGFSSLSIAAAATLNLGQQGAQVSEVLGGVTLDNAGAAALTGGGLDLLDGAAVDNQPTGSFTSNAFGISGDGTTSFLNEGTLTGYSLTILPVFTQTSTGLTAVEAGTLQIAGGGTISGPITVAAGTTLYLGNAPSTQVSLSLDSSSSISGAGSVVVGGPSVTEDGTYNVSGSTGIYSSLFVFNADATIQDLGSNLSVSTSTLTIASSQSLSFTTVEIYQSTVSGGGNGAMTVTGTVSWVGGTLSGFGSLSIPAASTLNLGQQGAQVSEVLDGVTLDNAGTATLSDIGYPSDYSLGLQNGAGVDNQAGGSFTFLTSAVIISGGAGTFFENAGMSIDAAGAGSDTFINAPFSNSGSVTVQQGTLGLGIATNSGTVTRARCQNAVTRQYA